MTGVQPKAQHANSSFYAVHLVFGYLLGVFFYSTCSGRSEPVIASDAAATLTGARRAFDVASVARLPRRQGRSVPHVSS